MANVTVLPEDYDGLKKEYLVLRKELDCVNQELYANKRQLKVVEALQVEYQSEIEILQSEESSEKIKLEEKIAQLEEQVTHVRSKYVKQIQSLESDLASKEEEIEKLRSEVELMRKSNVTEAPSDDVCKLLEELANLKLENETLLKNEEELKLSVEILHKKCYTLEETLTEYKEELVNFKESLSCKKDELTEANDLVQKLNDELLCLKNELESFKNKPLNAESKGNSLFAEVDDRRVYLQKTINNMKSEYISMKQERAKHLNMISHLKKENGTLCERWKKDMEEKEDDEYTVIKSYKDQIKILESLVEQYRKDLGAKLSLPPTGTFNEFQFCQKMLDDKSRAIEELREELNSRGLTHTLLSIGLKEANREMRKWRLEATLKQYELELKPGEVVSESVRAKATDEVMSDSGIELIQTKKGPRLTCRKEEKAAESERSPLKEEPEVVTLDDSADDVQVVDSGADEVLPQGPRYGILKSNRDEKRSNGTEEAQTEDKGMCDKEEPGKVSDSEEKENGEATRKVTFSQSTVSPKTTGRPLRVNCKRIVIPKPIYIP